MTVAVALTIAGSDSGGGAGIQADLKTFAAHGVYGTSALTLVTAQNTLGIRQSVCLEPALVQSQLEAVLDDFPVAAVKTGALGNAAIVEVVAEVLRGRGLPLIVDPVLRSTSAASLLDEDALTAMRTLLFPLATLMTPNLPEAEAIWGLPPGQLNDPEALTEFLAGPPIWPLLLKGGHGSGNVLTDYLLLPGQRRMLHADRQPTRHTHGTGCTLSAAIAAQLARGMGLSEAVERAHAYLQTAICAAPGLGAGNGPLEHFPPR